MHPDKIADRIAGAIVDLAYAQEANPRVAVEVLIGHGVCHIIAEVSCDTGTAYVRQIVERIAPGTAVDFVCVKQDAHLAANQRTKIRCGDNGIFKGVPLTKEQTKLSQIARDIFSKYQADGKYILNGERLTICQSNASTDSLLATYPYAKNKSAR